jgi:tetratricopeptide (TPR) repeat protein
MRRRWCLWAVICLSFLLLFCACGEDENGGTKVTAEELTDQGWMKFQAGDFNGAAADFNAAIGLDAEYTRAYLGLGWAELRRSRAGFAEDAFITYLAKSSAQGNDALAGLAFACDAESKPEEAIAYAEDLLTADPQWSFGQDSNVDYLDVALVLADNYYLTADYEQSLAIVQQYFDATFNPNIDTDQGRTELADKLASLYTG